MAMEVLHNTCNMQTHNLPDMYALRFQVYISGKSLAAMLQPLHTQYPYCVYSLQKLSLHKS